MNDDKELIRCVDCKHWPNACGYWGSKHKKHTCSGFILGDGMNLEETIYALGQMDIRRVNCNSQIINVAIRFLNELKIIKKT